MASSWFFSLRNYGLCYIELVGYVLVCLIVSFLFVVRFMSKLYTVQEKTVADGKRPVYSITYRHNLHP